MTLKEIKLALSNGKKVYHHNHLYEIRKSGDDYLICCDETKHYIGLTWRNNTTLNGKEKDFFTE